MTHKPFVLVTLLHLATALGAIGAIGVIGVIGDAGPAAPAAAPPAPCGAAENRQFDFWLGEWEVRVPAGGLAGLSQVSAILDGCVILERWQGQGGDAGFQARASTPTTRRRGPGASTGWTTPGAAAI